MDTNSGEKTFQADPGPCSQQRMKEKQGRLSPAQPVLPTASLSGSFTPPSPIHFALSFISDSKYKDDIFPSCLGYSMEDLDQGNFCYFPKKGELMASTLTVPVSHQVFSLLVWGNLDFQIHVCLVLLYGMYNAVSKVTDHSRSLFIK